MIILQEVLELKIGKVQGFLQGFLRACKKHFDKKHSESGLWDEFIARICSDYADQSGDPYLEDLSMYVQETNVVFYRIPVKCLKEKFLPIGMSYDQIAKLNHAKVEYTEDCEKEIAPTEIFTGINPETKKVVIRIGAYGEKIEEKEDKRKC